jgi:5-methylcytosine-specific restriction enzyme subunit McrC
MLTTYEHRLIGEVDTKEEALIKQNVLCSRDMEALDNLRKVPSYGNLLTTERHGLRFGGYCGVILSQTGRNIQVLPKTSFKDNDENEGRAKSYLKKMIESAFHVDPLEVKKGDIDTFDNMPLLDIYISIFLEKVADITHKGLKQSYIRTRGNLQAIKGKMLMNKQCLRLPHQQQINHLDYDVYSYERSENKLLAYCLRLVSRWASDHAIRKKAQQLKAVFADISESSKPKDDYKAWSSKRDIAYYHPAKQWVEYIIRYQSPYALAGIVTGPSLMFRTDKLFESYISRHLPKQLKEGFHLQDQVADEHLLRDSDGIKKYYTMKPDFVIYDQYKPKLILDAKWKIIEQYAFEGSHGDSDKMNESDLRQLYVYGHKYLDGEGDVVLIYPKHNSFTQALPMFDFSDGKNDLRLWVLPYDLDKGELILPNDENCQFSLNLKKYFK